MLDDLQLIQLTAEGRLEAFEALVNRHKNRIYNIAFSFTASHAESDDITQSVFLKVYLNLGSFERKAAFSTWLYRIAVNECYNGAKKRKHGILSLDAETGETGKGALKETIEDGKPGIEASAVSREEQLRVRKAVLSLPDKYRMIVTLRDIEDISYEEISGVMKISQDKVKVWLFRARSKLKELLINNKNTGGQK